MAQAWASGVPNRFEKSSWSHNIESGVIRTNMEGGPAKVRRRFTAVLENHSGTIIMTKTQFATFKSWVANTIMNGTLSFTFPDPFDPEEDIEVRMVSKSEKDALYMVKPAGDTLDLAVNFGIEVMP